MPIRRNSRLNTAVAMAMVRIADKLSSLVNTRAIITVAVGEGFINSIKDLSNIPNNILNSINKSTQTPLRVVEEEGVEALSITGHPLSRDVSYTTQHRSPKTPLPKAIISMGSPHVKSQLSK